jgi:subfamily B ATP-binding cassette protein MsbA
MKKTSTTHILKRVLREQGRRYAPQYALALGLMAVVAGTTGLSAWLMKDVIDDIFVSQDRSALLWLPSVIVAIFAVKGLSAYLQEVTLARIGNRITAEAQKRMFDHILCMEVGFFQKHPSARLVSQVTESARAVRDVLHLIATGAGRDVLTVLSLIGVMVAQDPVMSLICLLGGPLIGLGVKRLTKRARKTAQAEFALSAGLIGVVREAAQGIRVVKSFSLEDRLRRRANGAIDALQRGANKISALQAGVNPLMEMLAGVAVASVVLYAGWRSLDHGQTPGAFFSFITALLMTADPARRLARLHVRLATAGAGVRMMYELLDTPAAERPGAALPPLAVTKGEIRFNKVSFAYGGGVRVFTELDLVAPAGKMTALVGLSGSGKTTVFNLIQRFWTPESGTIAIDGQPLQTVSLPSLRRQIAFVSQDVFLFEGTIQDNIRAGQQSATDEDIAAAARAAHADEFIRALPRGYDTQVGELGTLISGGQRQRISIARAFLKNAPILLLDEPTSALDSETEQIIQGALKELAAGRTTLVIAHRLATVLSADLIHVIQAGRLIQSGTHRELSRADGLYARLYRLQFSSEPEREIA